MRTTEQICWAILVPGEPLRVAMLAEDEWQLRFGEVSDGEPWKIVACAEDFTAIVEPEPGSEGPDDPIAAALSRQVEGQVLLLRFHDEAPVVWAYERGRWTGELDESPESAAQRCGCPFVVEDTREPVFVWCYVAGAAKDEIVEALGETANEPWCHVEQEPSGVVVRSADGDIGGMAYDLSESLPARTVHEILAGPEPGEFTVTELAGGNRIRQSVKSADEIGK